MGLLIFPNKKEEELNVSVADDGNIDVTFMSRSVGIHDIVVRKYGEGPVKGSPFQIYIDVASQRQDKKCTVNFAEHTVFFTKKVAKEKQREKQQLTMQVAGGNKAIIGQE